MNEIEVLKNGDSNFSVYGIFPYDRSGKVNWLLAELGVPYDRVTLDISTQDHENPKFLALNPMGRIPVLEFKGSGMFESGGICAYLTDLYLEKGMAPKLDSPLRAQYQQWMYFAASTLDVFQIRIMIIEDIPAGEVQSRKLTELQTDLRDALVAVNKVVSKASFLVGDKFSTADICVSYHLTWLSLWPELESVIRDFPKVKNYVTQMQSTPSAKKADVFSYKG